MMMIGASICHVLLFFAQHWSKTLKCWVGYYYCSVAEIERLKSASDAKGLPMFVTPAENSGEHEFCKLQTNNKSL